MNFDTSVSNMWSEFLDQNPEFKDVPMPKPFHFCDNEKDANECAELVIKKIKKATSTSLWWFNKNKVGLPKPGDVNIITDWKGIPKAIIKTIQVDHIPFSQVTEEYAMIEGEGDFSLSYWQKIHWDYYTREMEPFGELPKEEMIIICEQFETIWI